MNTLQWSGLTERIKSEEVVKSVCEQNSGTYRESRRGKPLGKWKESTKEYVHVHV